MKREAGEGERLRQAIILRPAASSPLSEELRQEAIAYTRDRVAQGASQVAVARELAVTAMTVSRWLATAKPRSKPKAATPLRRVQVVEARRSAASGLVVTTLQGLRIEGMTFEDIVALVRALG